jgi:hypothetical protein
MQQAGNKAGPRGRPDFGLREGPCFHATAPRKG